MEETKIQYLVQFIDRNKKQNTKTPENSTRILLYKGVFLKHFSIKPPSLSMPLCFRCAFYKQTKLAWLKKILVWKDLFLIRAVRSLKKYFCLIIHIFCLFLLFDIMLIIFLFLSFLSSFLLFFSRTFSYSIPLTAFLKCYTLIYILVFILAI